MAYIDDVKKAEKEINKAFNISSLEDYTAEEQENYNRIQSELNDKNISIEEYKRNIDRMMTETVENMRLQEKYFQELVANEDPKALEIKEKISLKEKAYHDEKVVFNAKKEAFENNNQIYNTLINEHKLAEQKIAEKSKEMNECLGEATEKAEQKEAKRIEDLNKKLEEQNKKKDEIALKLVEATKYEKNTNDAIQAQKENGMSENDLSIFINIHNDAKKSLDSVLKEANTIDNEIAKLSKQLEDKRIIEADREKIAKKYAAAQEERMKLVEEEGKREIKILNAKANHDQLEREYKEQKNTNDIYATDYAFAREEARQYAGKLAKEKMESLSLEFKTANNYIKMKEQISNDIPNKNSNTIIKGANALNSAYQSYKNSHNPVARFFNFLPFLDSYKDYQIFNALRERYMGFSGVNKEDINKYLDTNGKEKTGALKAAFEDSFKEKVETKKQIDMTEEIEEDNNSIQPISASNEKALEDELSIK